MNQTKANYLVDILMGISFFVSAITGIVISIFLPRGIRQGGAQEFLGVTKSAWSTLHEWSGVMMILLVLVHLILHWRWMVCMTKSIMLGDKKAKRCD